jgi:hypothetical protein
MFQDDDSPLLELFTVDVSDTETAAAEKGANKMAPKPQAPNLVTTTTVISIR